MHIPLEIKREAFKTGMERRARLFGHIDGKEMLEDFEKWRKARGKRKLQYPLVPD